MKNLKPELFQFVLRNRTLLLLLSASLLLLFIFFNELKAIAVVFSLSLLGAFGQVYKRIARIPSAFEFVTFGTVIIAVAYGPVAGMLFAAAVSFAAEIISGGIDAFVLIYWPVRILSGAFAALVPFGSVFAAGVATTLFINLLAQPVYLLSSDTEVKMRAVIYLIGNIVFNAILFKLLGKIVLGIA